MHMFESLNALLGSSTQSRGRDALVEKSKILTKLEEEHCARRTKSHKQKRGTEPTHKEVSRQKQIAQDTSGKVEDQGGEANRSRGDEFASLFHSPGRRVLLSANSAQINHLLQEEKKQEDKVEGREEGVE